MPAYKTYANRREMEAAGYRFSNQFTDCRDCGAQIEWASTKNGKRVPFNPQTCTCHFDSCQRGNGHAQPVSSQAAVTSLARPEPVPITSSADLAALTRAIQANTKALLELIIARGCVPTTVPSAAEACQNGHNEAKANTCSRASASQAKQKQSNQRQ